MSNLSEEEKKAIEELKSKREYFEWQPEGCNWRLSFDQWEVNTIIDVVINLIDRQQKEIKELSEKLTEKICKGVEEEILEEYRQKINNQQKEIEQLRDTNKKLYEIGKQRAIQEILNENYISKDKIRKKIKELKKMKLTKGDIFFKMRNYAILILRELLEE